MDRRRFLLTTLAGAVAAPLAGEAQQPRKVYRLGAISSVGMFGAPETQPGQGAFWDRMRELGWVYGQTVVIEQRMFGDDVERVPEIATDLVHRGTDVFLVPNGSTAGRVQRVTRTTPIVVTVAGDLVAAGLAASLARPGGNITGIQVMQTEMAGKHLSLLKEAIFGLSRVGALIGDQGFSEANLTSERSANAAWVREIKARAAALGLHAQAVIIGGSDDVEKAFSTFKSQRTQAIVIYGSTLMSSLRQAIAALALRHRLPTICIDVTLLSAGYLMSYGWDRREIPRAVAEIVDKIFRGTKVGDIPVQQPTNFSFAVNLKTAKALGLTLPPSLLARADQVID